MSPSELSASHDYHDAIVVLAIAALWGLVMLWRLFFGRD